MLQVATICYMPHPTSIRLKDETLKQLDALAEKLEIPSRSLLISMAVRRMARAELGTTPGDRSKPATKKARKR